MEDAAVDGVGGAAGAEEYFFEVEVEVADTVVYQLFHQIPYIWRTVTMVGVICFSASI